MNELTKKYHRKRLTTDEAAEARTAIDNAIKELESIDLKYGKDYLLLKWGTLKGYDLKSETGKKLQDEYGKLGRSMSVMSQEDSPEQKKIICQMIDECDGLIQNDWDGNYYTKQQAKEYITGYQKND